MKVLPHGPSPSGLIAGFLHQSAAELCFLRHHLELHLRPLRSLLHWLVTPFVAASACRPLLDCFAVAIFDLLSYP